MPRALFDQTLVSSPARRRKPLGTVLISIGLHLIVLGLLVTLQVTEGLNTPLIASHLQSYVIAVIPVPPDVTPARTTANPKPSPAPAERVPTEAPDHIWKEPPTPPESVTPSFDTGIIGPQGGIGSGGADTGVHLAEAPPPPAPTGPIPVGGKVLPPTRLDNITPQYPDIARMARVEGDVVLEATIDERGDVTHVVVKKSVSLLDAAAIAAVSRWRYSPTKLNGQPIAVTMLVTVRFSLH